MKLISTKDFIPLAISTLAISTQASTETLNQGDVNDMDNYINNTFTKEYLDNTKKNSYNDLLTEVKFKEHLRSWKMKTAFMSSPNSIIEDEDFQSIIKMGQPCVKYILQELENEPSYLVWALNIMYGFKISNNERTTIPEAAKMWTRYLKKQS